LEIKRERWKSVIIFEWGNLFRVRRKRRIMRKEGEHWKEGKGERAVCCEIEDLRCRQKGRERM